MSAVITQKHTTKPVDEVPREAFRDYSVKLKKMARESGDAFKKIARAKLKNATSQQEMKSILYHAANNTFEQCANATGKLSCDFFETYIKGAKQTEIAPVPKYIKKRLYEHIEDILAGRAADDEGVLDLIADHVITEGYQHGNRTTRHNAIRNGLRYARVPSGTSCAFCLMLASRGFVYHSATTAGEDKGHYHGNCRCKIVAGKEGTEIEGYNPEALNRRMQQVAKELGITNFNWEDYISDKAMQDLLQREIRLRDENWLLTGKVPEPTYASGKIKKSVTIDNPWENRTALRLAQHGYKPNFIVDFITVKGNGVKRRVGLPDFASGLEIKTLTTSKNAYGAVGNYLEKSQKKKGLKKLVIDNSESVLADEDVLKAIKKLKPNYKIKNIALLLKSGELISI